MKKYFIWQKYKVFFHSFLTLTASLRNTCFTCFLRMAFTAKIVFHMFLWPLGGHFNPFWPGFWNSIMFYFSYWKISTTTQQKIHKKIYKNSTKIYKKSTKNIRPTSSYCATRWLTTTVTLTLSLWWNVFEPMLRWILELIHVVL